MAVSSGNDREASAIEALTTRQVVVGRRPPPAEIRLKERYLLGKVLGHGSLGTTYRAVDELMQRPVAVKLLSERYANDTAFNQRLMAATAAAGRLNHPHIVTVLDAGLIDGRPFIVMELVEGQSLRPFLANRGKLSIEQCMTIAIGVADALIHAHHQRVIHGDLRPENVLLDSRGTVKVADFGFVRAAVATDRTLIGGVLQRAAYNAPEQLLQGTVDERTDIYGLGTLLYELLTGAPPVSGAHAMSALSPRRFAVTPPHRLRADVPPRLDSAVVRALAPEPGSRFNSAQELRLALAGPEKDVISRDAAVPPVWRRETHLRPRRGSRPIGHHAAALVPIGVSLAILLAAALAFTVVFPRTFGGFQMTEVPNLLDHDLTEATTIASAHGLTLKVASTQPTDDRPKDAILGQDPQVGGRLRRGSEVKVTLSSGMRPPNVVGKPIEEARMILTRAGWPVAGLESQANAAAPAGTVVGSRPRPDETAEDKKRGVTLLVSGGNLVYRRPLTLADGSSGPEAMVDGDSNTMGKLGGPAPRWVEIDLGGPATVAAVELVTSQDQPGVSIHEIWLWRTDDQFRGMHTFVGPTEDNQTLSIRFDEPVRDARAIRIATTQAPGEVGWREIRVFPQ